MPKLQTADRVFLTLEGQVPQHVAVLGTLVKPEGAPSDYVQRVADRLRQITTYAAPFNFRLAWPVLKAVAPSYAVVADEDIDLSHHVSVQSLPRPGAERQLGELVSRLHSLPMDMARPLWEFHLIDGLMDNRFGLYFKVHHAVIDGIGGVQRLQRMLTTDPTDLDQRPLWSLSAPKSQSAPTTRPSGVLEAVRTIQGLGRIMVRNALDARRSDQPDLAVPSKAPHTILNGRIGPHRRVATQNYDYARLRAVAAAHNVTLNDVFLAMAGGALRRYLTELDGLPADSLLAGTPVNVRVEGDDSTNAFSFTVMRLATDVADPVERILAINRSSTVAKARLTGLSKPVAVNSAVLFMAPFLIGNLFGLAGRGRSPFNVYLSNVPGPVAQQYWAGATLEAMCPLGIPMHGAGLFIAALTVSGKFCVGIVGDSDSVPHVQRIAVHMGEALEELELTTGAPPS